MNLLIFIGILMGMLLFSLYLGKKASKETKSKEDFFLMGRKLPFLSLLFTMLATQLGGGALMGAADEAYARGWGILFYPLGMVFGLLVLGFGFGARLRSFKLSTVSEIFEKIYKSPFLRRLAACLSIISLFFILVAQGIAARKFFVTLGFESSFWFVLFWGVLVLYTAFGGLRAVVKTDILQASFILGAFSLTFLSLWLKPMPTLASTPLVFSSQESLPWAAWLLMPLLFMLIEQDMGQRCFAAKSPKAVSFAGIGAGLILLLVTFCPIYLGRLAKLCNLSIPEGGSVLLSCGTQFFGPLVSSFLMAAILMAILSTADSLLCSVSSNLCCDFPFFAKKQSLTWTRFLTFLVGLGALALTFAFESVVSVLIFSYELSVSIIAVPVIMAVIRKKGEKGAAITSILIGAFGFVLFRFFPILIPKEVVTIGLSCGGFWGYVCWDIFVAKRMVRPVVN